MKAWAYCAKPYLEATRRAAGVEPLVCPPVVAETLDLAHLEGNDLIFLNLHALPEGHALLGSRYGPPVALRVRQLDSVDLGGAVVFAECCYLGDEYHPMRHALLRAGASAVIAGPGPNFGSRTANLKSADLLGLWFRRGLTIGLPPKRALRMARARLRFAALRSPSAGDALGFRVFESEWRKIDEKN